jgi:hypothetical protein
MGGFFGAVSRKNCKYDVFFGTDYHSHLGTKRGGLAFYDAEQGFDRQIHNIQSTPFRTKFEGDLAKMNGTIGIGNAADTGTAAEFGQIIFKFGAEGCVFNVVDLALKALFLIIECHAAPAGAQVGMVVRTKKHIQYAVFTGDSPKKTTHMRYPPCSSSA